jgi:hypothetical protein
MNENKRASIGFLARITSSPITVLVGIILSFVSIALAVLLFFAQKQFPKLVFAERERTLMVRKDIPSDLEIKVGDTSVSGTEVVATQVSFWNAGNKAIKGDQVLEPVRISFNPQVHILRASVTRMSRSLTGFTIANEGGTETGLELKWRILEPGDGGVIQIVFAGLYNSTLTVNGAVEEQRRMVNISFTRKQLLALLIAAGGLLVQVGLTSIKARADKSISLGTRILVRFVVGSFFVGLLFIAFWVILKIAGFSNPAPPF